MTEYAPSDIAIVGMSSKLPGADTPEEFWENLRAGKECIEDLADADLLALGVCEDTLRDTNYVKRAPLLHGVEWFDAPFFGLSPNEANVMDPQHRLFLECGQHALENAGYFAESFEGPIGVFGGSGYNAYMTYHLARNEELMESMGFFLLRHTGNDKDFLTTRLSYCLNLKGPSINVQTACSTSLVAIHLATQSLNNFECDMALAGGSTIELPLGRGYRYSPGEIYSPDGHCRAFDAEAQGTIFGSGCGVVVLRRMEDALRDRDNIRAVIKGSALNNDGAGKAGYLAPSVDGQAKAILEALEFSDVDPETVTYIETHGTGTSVGDPIEISALTAAYGAKTDKKQFCAIGSVKTNIGHLDTAAGVASLIKTVLSLEHEEIPASLHYKTPNPEIDFKRTPFYVNAELQDWPRKGLAPLRAAVSSLGVGGTNAHVILEEPPELAASGPSRDFQLILLSAKNEISLQTAGDNLVDCVTHCDYKLADVAYTLQVGRQSFEYRKAIVCSSPVDLTKKIDSVNDPMVVVGNSVHEPSVVFMFTGQGSQFVNMAKDLYGQETIFQNHFDQCREILVKAGGPNVHELIIAARPDSEADVQRLNQTENTQPALFVIEYCMAQLWLHWGVKPDAMIGHSIGEYVAACLCGVFSLENALQLVSLRGRLMQSAQPGSMLAVSIAAGNIESYISDRVELAAINSTSLCVLSGSDEDIKNMKLRLEEDGLSASMLRTSHAFHSRSMEPILVEFEKAVVVANPQPPKSPFISNLTGNWIRDDEAVDPGYWSQHLRRPVQFSEGITTLLGEKDRVFLEIGPGAILSQLVGQHESVTSTETVIASLAGIKSPYQDGEQMLNALACLWVAGIDPDWSNFYGDQVRRRVILPGYAFNRQRHWVDPDGLSGRPVADVTQDNSVSESSIVYSGLQWSPLPIKDDARKRIEKVLVLGPEGDETTELEAAFDAAGVGVFRVIYSDSYDVLANNQVHIRKGVLEDYENSIDLAQKFGVELIVHCGGYLIDADKSVDAAIEDSFVSPLLVLQAAVNFSSLDLVFLSRNAYRVSGHELQMPLGSLATGPGLVANLELPHLNTCILDVGDQAAVEVLDGILSVAHLGYHKPGLFALRSGIVYGRTIEPMTVSVNSEAFVDADACYLITGGLSGLGYEVARYFVESGQKNIALLGRTSLPAECFWDDWLACHHADDPITSRMRKILALRKAGANVAYYAIDLSDEDQLNRCADRVSTEIGRIAGIVHCAGELDDGPLLSKEVDQVLKVLEPKVQGSLHLAKLAERINVRDFILFSSVSSLWGTPGQVDYVAANAFIDALVSDLQAKLDGRVVSLNWSAWSQTGMTERTAYPVIPDSAQISHPLIDACLFQSRGTSVYASQMCAGKHWVVDEHRAAGSNEPILPGTGFLEMVKAAFDPLAAHSNVIFTDVMFLSPFVLADDEPRELRIQFEPWSLGTTFSVISQADAGDRESWFTHMKGRITSSKLLVKEIDLEVIRRRCSPRESHPNEQEKFLNFGPRWNSVQSVQLGDAEAIIELKLDDAFVGDIETIWSHPGMLDVATAGVLKIVPGYEADQHFYVPIAYDRIEFFGAMPAHWVSHIVYKPELSDPGDIVVFDVTITDADGKICAVFSDFMLKCIEGPNVLVSSRPPLSARAIPVSIDALNEEPNLLLRERLEQSGLETQAGIGAFSEIFSSGIQGQVAITCEPLEVVLQAITRDGLDQVGLVTESKTQIDVTSVEECLLRHEAVTNSVVVAKDDRFGETKIAAFVQLDSMVPTTVSELRRYVRKEMEDHLVPSKFVELDNFVFIESGEIDRSQLPDPFGDTDDFVAPSTETEKMLTQIWQDILGVDRISITDNFFDLGGHSLLGVRLLAAIRKQTEIRLEDVVVVTYTLEQISAELEKRISEK